MHANHECGLSRRTVFGDSKVLTNLVHFGDSWFDILLAPGRQIVTS
jgi:hypothetical protein